MENYTSTMETTKRRYMKLGCRLLLGDRLEWLIDKVTFGNGAMWSYKIARFLGFKDCGCEKRRIWLNKLTCKEYKSYE